jgi:hypothetical protein
VGGADNQFLDVAYGEPFDYIELMSLVACLSPSFDITALRVRSTLLYRSGWTFILFFYLVLFRLSLILFSPSISNVEGDSSYNRSYDVHEFIGYLQLRNDTMTRLIRMLATSKYVKRNFLYKIIQFSRYAKHENESPVFFTLIK